MTVLDAGYHLMTCRTINVSFMLMLWVLLMLELALLCQQQELFSHEIGKTSVYHEAMRQAHSVQNFQEQLITLLLTWHLY